MSIARGEALMFTRRPVSGFDARFRMIATGRVGFGRRRDAMGSSMQRPPGCSADDVRPNTGLRDRAATKRRRACRASRPLAQDDDIRLSGR